MTQSKPYRVFTIVMAFVVLLSSTGFGVLEHSCMMRGKSVELAVLKKSESGCKSCVKKQTFTHKKSSQAVFKKKACCEESQKYQKVEVVTSSLSSVSFKAALGSAATLTVPFSFKFSEWCGAPPSIAFSFFTFSSLRHGRSMLSFVQSFLI